MLTDHRPHLSLLSSFKIKREPELGDEARAQTSVFLADSSEGTRPGLFWISEHKWVPDTHQGPLRQLPT